MNEKPIAIALAVLAGAASSVLAQPTSDSADGLSRVCSYPSAYGRYSGAGNVRSHRVGLAENCPATYPDRGNILPLPPTARLQNQTDSNNGRSCIYEQAGDLWQRTVPLAQSCPLWAGQLASRDVPTGRQ